MSIFYKKKKYIFLYLNRYIWLYCAPSQADINLWVLFSSKKVGTTSKKCVLYFIIAHCLCWHICRFIKTIEESAHRHSVYWWIIFQLQDSTEKNVYSAFPQIVHRKNMEKQSLFPSLNYFTNTKIYLWKYTDIFFDTTIERLDQSHLYPNLEVPGLTCPGLESNPGLPRGKRTLKERATQTAC